MAGREPLSAWQAPADGNYFVCQRQASEDLQLPGNGQFGRGPSLVARWAESYLRQHGEWSLEHLDAAARRRPAEGPHRFQVRLDLRLRLVAQRRLGVGPRHG